MTARVWVAGVIALGVGVSLAATCPALADPQWLSADELSAVSGSQNQHFNDTQCGLLKLCTVGSQMPGYPCQLVGNHCEAKVFYWWRECDTPQTGFGCDADHLYDCWELRWGPKIQGQCQMACINSMMTHQWGCTL